MSRLTIFDYIIMCEEYNSTYVLTGDTSNFKLKKQNQNTNLVDRCKQILMLGFEPYF
jgi:hypothetical protein